MYAEIFNKYSVRLPDDVNSEWPIRFAFLVPIYHPAIFPHNNYMCGSSVEDCIKQFTDLDYACNNPYNIDAALLYKRHYDKFIEKNMEIFEKCQYRIQIIL